MSLINQSARYYRTLRHVKPSQIVWRLWYRFHQPKVPTFNEIIKRRIDHAWIDVFPVKSPFCEDDVLLLNKKIHKPLDQLWQDREQDHLWLYHLHYFDYLNESTEWVITHWLKHNSPGQGVGWEPYPTSLRIVNWIRFYLAHEVQQTVLQSLYQQAFWLSQKIEYHLLGNHLLANGKALLFAGLFFETDEAKQWLLIAKKLLIQQLNEQILENGAHYELSPMYQGIVIMDCLDILNILQVYQLPDTLDLEKLIRQKLPRLLQWLHKMTHPDGAIAFFNDSTFGVSRSLADLQLYATQLNVLEQDNCHSGSQSTCGYYRLENTECVVLADCGDIGPSYQPGHAHADTLSFEMSLGPQRIFVNSGIDRYGVSPERIRQRSASAHSTVVIDDIDSSEVWHGFRVGRRVKIQSAIFDRNKLNSAIAYLHILQQRQWDLQSDQLIIHDKINCHGQHSLIGYYYLHPDIQYDQLSNYKVTLTSNDFYIEFISVLPLSIHKSQYFVGYNKARDSHCIQLQGGFKECIEFATTISWKKRH